MKASLRIQEISLAFKSLEQKKKHESNNIVFRFYRFFFFQHLQKLQRSQTVEHATGQVFDFVAVQHPEKKHKFNFCDLLGRRLDKITSLSVHTNFTTKNSISGQ